MIENILQKIQSPKELKSLSIDSLESLCEEIREEIIRVMAVNGGHLASNLGSVELIVALHYVFASPDDKIVFDTSHQIYPHKLLTGRLHEFPTIRKFKGLSGFASPAESPHDHFYAGHAGSALSQSLGVAKGRDLNKRNFHVIPFISDAPMSCGLTLEALNNVPKDLKNFIIVLNDNAWAISGAVGAMHHNILGRFGIPRKAHREASSFFRAFNLKYFGPLDGHDLKTLIRTLEEAKNTTSPILLHALTNKGHGMPQAMKDPTTYHGVKPFDPESGKFHPMPNAKATFPKVFGKHVLEMARRDKDIVAVTPAMPRGSCLDGFMEEFPDRCMDVGIAEGHAVTYAGGIAYRSDKKVIASIYATFFQRALDNLFQDVCLQELPVLFALDRGGFSPQDGTTHHGIYDIGFMNAMPGMVIAQPRDGDVLKDLLESSFSWGGPSAIRYPNMVTESTDRPRIARVPGEAEILEKGKDVVIIALGHMCNLALDVRKMLLDSNIEATVIDPIFVKPLDKSLLFKLMLDHHYFITIEEHAVNSGLGAIVNSFIMQSGFNDINIMNFGIPDQFIEHGSYKDLMEQVGLTAPHIAEQIKSHLCPNALETSKVQS